MGKIKFKAAEDTLFAFHPSSILIDRHEGKPIIKFSFDYARSDDLFQ